MRTSRNPCFLRWRWTVLCHNDGKICIVFYRDYGSASLGELHMVSKRAAKLVGIGLIVAGTLVAESRKEYHFAVGPRAGVSVMNPYGSISVKPSQNNTVIVNAVLHSDRVEVDNNQSGNRVDIQSHLLPGADAESGRVDYEILVPPDANVTLHCSTGSMRAERLHGDVNLEGADATVDVRDVSNAHVHVKT